jgi:hypothetical protein
MCVTPAAMATRCLPRSLSNDTPAVQTPCAASACSRIGGMHESTFVSQECGIRGRRGRCAVDRARRTGPGTVSSGRYSARAHGRLRSVVPDARPIDGPPPMPSDAPPPDEAAITISDPSEHYFLRELTQQFQRLLNIRPATGIERHTTCHWLPPRGPLTS